MLRTDCVQVRVRRHCINIELWVPYFNDLANRFSSTAATGQSELTDELIRLNFARLAKSL